MKKILEVCKNVGIYLIVPFTAGYGLMTMVMDFCNKITEFKTRKRFTR